MVFGTLTVSLAITAEAINTFISHYVHRKALAGKPTVHLSYDEGLHLIRKFLLNASHYTVEEVQRFTSQWVPHPISVKVANVRIGQEHITKAAEALQAQLGPHGIEQVGGKTWWQWRGPGNELKAEWIEMKADYNERKKSKENGKRVMLYAHGGGYFLGSVDDHRYQMQRHARKLKARVFAPRYRLAPQFPFPCGLHDCLAAYLYLLTVQEPTTIIFAGDSAGAALVLSLLVIIRDQGLPAPAGAILISPWVDLTHSFPSVADVNPMDYVPTHGFHHRPSSSWPPPNVDEMLEIAKENKGKHAHKQPSHQPSEQEAVQGFHVIENLDSGAEIVTAATGLANLKDTHARVDGEVGSGPNLSIELDGKLIEITDQIQMYTTNQLLAHPLVSPILQPSLGGLPPLLVMTGGAEALRDEQIYLAHKAADPEKYPPGDIFLERNSHQISRDQIKRWNPTDVQLQLWEDLCHAAPTLSFTRPAKYMYRSIAQFGAWALTRAQKSTIEIPDEEVSTISRSGDGDKAGSPQNEPATAPQVHVGKAGDPLPPFQNHMIRQRVDRHGVIYPLEPASSLQACSLPPDKVGVVKEGSILKWMVAKQHCDTKYASARRRVQRQRIKEMIEGYEIMGGGEVPPPSALVGRRRKVKDREKKHKRGSGVSLWSRRAGKHDENTIQQADKLPKTTDATGFGGANARSLQNTDTMPCQMIAHQSQSQTVTNEHQTDQEDLQAAKPLTNAGKGDCSHCEHLTPDPPAEISTEPSSAECSGDITTRTALEAPPATISSPSTLQLSLIDTTNPRRSKIGGIAIPFSLNSRDKDNRPVSNLSMATLTSSLGISPSRYSNEAADPESGVTDNTSGDKLTPHS